MFTSSIEGYCNEKTVNIDFESKTFIVSSFLLPFVNQLIFFIKTGVFSPLSLQRKLQGPCAATTTTTGNENVKKTKAVFVGVFLSWLLADFGLLSLA